MKFNPLPEIVEGKRVVVVDDSIVRGNTTRQIVGMLREAGATEVHLRISAPPIRFPCHYGVDMSTREEMVAHERTSTRSPSTSAPTRSPTSRSTASTRRSGLRRRTTATPASPAATRSARATAASSRSSSWRPSRPALAGPDLGVANPGDGQRAAVRCGWRCSRRGPGRTCRRSSTRCTGAERSRWSGSPPTSRRRRALERAREAGVETAAFPIGDYADREARDLAIADWLAGLDVELVVLAGYMQLLSGAFIRRFPRPDHQRAPGAASGVPGARRDRAGDRARRAGDRGDRALRRRGRRHRADPPAARRRAHIHSPGGGGDRARSIGSSTSCCRAPIELIAAGAVSFDEENPRLVRIEER